MLPASAAHNSFSKTLHYSIAFIFFSLSIIWLGIKLDTSRNVGGDLTLLTYIDLIRSQSGLDFALVLLFFLHARITMTKASSVLSLLLFLISTFYCLKLTGLYAYTYDSTPWGMITYGSFLLQIPFSGEHLSLIGYIITPALLVLVLSYILLLNTPKKIFVLFIPLLILCSCIPPLQKQVPYSIALHPYIYSISGAFSSGDEGFTPKTNTDIEPQKIQTKTLTTLNKNVVLIILESFSASSITQKVTPTLLSIKQQSLNFEQAYALIPHTSKALVNIHCPQGAYFSPYLWESLYSTRGNCLSNLSENKSVFFQGITQSFENRAALISQLGYQEFYSLEDMETEGFQAVNYFSYEDNIVLPTSKKWLGKNLENFFIATYLTGTSHHNYQTPDDFPKLAFSDKPKLNRYLNSLHYVDSFVALLLAQYKELGLYNNTLFIFVGDHGEGFDLSKPLMHNNNIFQSGIHIPLFFYEPGNLKPENHNGLVSQNDIVTIIEHLSHPKNSIAGRKQVISSCWYMSYCYSLVSPRDGELFKYIWDKKNNRSMLFNITQDQQEQDNLINHLPVLSKQLHTQLLIGLTNNLNVHQQYFFSKDPNYLDKRVHTFSKYESVKY